MRRGRHASTHHYVISGSLALALGACADDGTISSSTTDDGDPGASDTDPALVNWQPARGISITEIEANQGTRVAITGEGGEWRGPDQRNMLLVSNRDTLIRVHFEVDEGWRPREVMARLTLDVGAAAPIVKDQIMLVNDGSSRNSLTRTFYFGLVAENGETVPGARISVELLEGDYDVDTSVPERVNVAPASGPQLLGFESDPMQMKVMLVPIRYTGGEGDERVPNLDEANVDTLIDALYEHNPVSEIIYQVRGAVEYDEPMENLGSLLPLMAALKQHDGVDPNIYYHAFIDIGCPVVGCGSSGVAGIAVVAGSTQNAGTTRVGASVFWTSQTDNIEMTTGTFVHEIGHNQGLAHVACPGVDAASPDPGYPYDKGMIGEWGFGIRSLTLHSPTSSHDYMTYCGNTWGSDWTYLKTYERIRTLTSWDFADAGHEAGAGDEAGLDEWVMGEELVVGALYPDGTEQWFALDGAIEVEEIAGGETLAFELDGRSIEQPVVLRTLSDGETQWVIAPLPEGRHIDEVERLEHRRGGEVRRVLTRDDIEVDLVAGTDITL